MRFQSLWGDQVDAGMPDYALESVIIKVAGTEFLWYAANRVFQLAGGSAYITDQPYEKILRDIRIFPIFEGANDVLRVFIALSGLKSLGDELSDLQKMDLAQPIRSLGVLADYVENHIRREIRPDCLEQIDDNDDERMHRIARATYVRRGYTHSI